MKRGTQKVKAIIFLLVYIAQFWLDLFFQRHLQTSDSLASRIPVFIFPFSLGLERAGVSISSKQARHMKLKKDEKSFQQSMIRSSYEVLESSYLFKFIIKTLGIISLLPKALAMILNLLLYGGLLLDDFYPLHFLNTGT